MKRDLAERLADVAASSGLITGIANPLYDFLNKLFQETPLRPLKVLANGTWFEHPLHPVLTDVPVGTWTLAVVLDLITLVFGVQNLGLASGIAIGLGILAALAAMATGFMDWMDVDPPEKAVGMLHAIVNIIATILFAIAFFMLWNGGWTISISNFVVALVGYLVITLGAYLGGDLVFRMGTMINRNAYRTGPKEFAAAIPLADLPENQFKRVDVKGQPVLLSRRGSKIYAIGAVCSHYGGPLEKGKLIDNTVQCPFHYSRFSLDDGSVREGPSTAPAPAYETQVVNGMIQVRMRK